MHLLLGTMVSALSATMYYVSFNAQAEAGFWGSKF